MILALLFLGGAAIIALAAWAGLAAIGTELWQAAWVVAPACLIMLAQLHLSAIAWRISIGTAKPRISRYFRVRLIREAVNSMLPVAQLGGNILAVRLLAQRGVPAALAGAGTTLDITCEVVSQLVFTLAGIAALAATAGGAGQPWVIATLAVMALAAAAFIAAQRAGLLRLVEALIRPLRAVFPGISIEVVRNLHAELMRLHRDRRAVLAAVSLHLAAWFLGVLETWLAFHAMGRPIGLVAALAIESLGMAARSAGFAIPGALGVQEGGFVLAAAPFAIPPEQAIALSMVKRARELVIGVAGLVMWQVTEGKRLLAARQASGNGGCDRD